MDFSTSNQSILEIYELLKITISSTSYTAVMLITESFAYSSYCTYTVTSGSGSTGGDIGTRNRNLQAVENISYYFHMYIYSSSGSLVGSTTTSFLSLTSSTKNYVKSDFDETTESSLILFKSFFMLVGTASSGTSLSINTSLSISSSDFLTLITASDSSLTTFGKFLSGYFIPSAG